jgi:hypothetical protein
MSLTVYFDGQYWVGLVEWPCEDGVRYARHIFGAEPTDIDVLNFVRHELDGVLARAATASSEDDLNEAVLKPTNPKRAAREAAKVMRQPVVSTKAQETLQREHEAHKQAAHQQSKAAREALAEHKRDIARQKAREKHRGH